MAADGIFPSIIPTEFCLHLFHHQSRSLVPSIITYTECVIVAFGTQPAMRMRHIFICVVSVCTFFSTLSHKRYNIRQEINYYYNYY